MDEMKPRATPPLEILDGERYACHQCGRCCRGEWLIEITAEEVERIGRLYPGMDATHEAVAEKGRKTWTLRRRPDQARGASQACVFLEPDNACRIQREHGAEAKPAVCRLFPYFFRAREGRMTVHLSRTCPSVFFGRGPILDAATALASLAPTRVHSLGTPEVLAGKVRLSPDEGRRALEFLSRLVLDERFALDEAVRAGGVYIERLIARGFHIPGAEETIDLVLEGVRRYNPVAGLENYLASVSITALEAAQWGKGLGLAPRRAALFARLLFSRGRVRFAILGDREVPLSGLGAIAWPRKSPPDLAPVRRFLASHILQGTVESASDIETGYRLLAGAYALARRFAKMVAASEGRAVLNDDDLFEGVATVEYQLLLHRPDIGDFGRNFWVRNFVRRFFFAPEYWGSI